LTAAILGPDDLGMVAPGKTADFVELGQGSASAMYSGPVRRANGGPT
jgi:adenine deaminase